MITAKLPNPVYMSTNINWMFLTLQDILHSPWSNIMFKESQIWKVENEQFKKGQALIDVHKDRQIKA